MIPKKIHYCWFGRGNKPELAVKCIESWKKYLPEYQIIEWNEENFDVSSNQYVKEAYDSKKYAFVTDVVRLHALYTEGGIYMDTDVEVIKPLDSILQYKGISGFETLTNIPTGLMASEKGHPLVEEWLKDYENRHFINKDGNLDLTTNVTTITNICKKYGFIGNNQLQTIKDYTFLPKEYLCPKSYSTGEIELTDKTLVIHHFAGSWHGKKEKLYNKVVLIFGSKVAQFLSNFWKKISR